METNTFNTLIGNRVRKGYDKATSVVILNQLLVAHTGDNLAHALTYSGFATEKQAIKIATEKETNQ